MNDVTEISEAGFSSADEADMAVVVNDKPSTWLWTFAGPGHPKTIAQNDRLSRESLHREKLQEQARVNGRKWTALDRSPEDVRAENISWVLGRLLRWTPVKIDGQMIEFSEEAALRMLSDPSKTLLQQSVDFLMAEKAFTKRSATTSGNTPSASLS